MRELKDMTALVTGGSSGIGLEYARQLMGKGCSVVIVSNREQELAEAERTLASAGGEKGQGVGVRTDYMDLAQPGCAQKLLDWCDQNDLQIDILINNAGMFFIEYLNEESLQKAHTMMNLHIQTVTELCILFGARMKARGKGYILNMSSMTARIPAPGIAIYSASKAYLKSFSKGFGYEMRPYGVKVTTVCPAAVDTGLYKLGPKTRKAGRRIGLIQSPESLVKGALRALKNGRRTYSPGIMNAILPPIIAIIPNRIIDRLGMKWML